jgi:hypothetical protein
MLMRTTKTTSPWSPPSAVPAAELLLDPLDHPWFDPLPAGHVPLTSCRQAL